MTDTPRPDRFYPPRSALRRLRVRPDEDLERASLDPDAFWLSQAAAYGWTRAPTTALTWNRPCMGWFEDGETNITLNALDRHAQGETRTRAALIWVSEDEQVQIYTYGTLHDQVSRGSGSQSPEGAAG